MSFVEIFNLIILYFNFMNLENDNNDSDPIRKGIMNRIGWFTYLRVVFTNTPKHPSNNYSTLKKDFLLEIITEQSVNIPY
jgi:hypothetical protein